MANDPSRASIAMHYAIMGVIVVWIFGLGFYVFY
jgi:hypothetical protein